MTSLVLITCTLGSGTKQLYIYDSLFKENVSSFSDVTQKTILHHRFLEVNQRVWKKEDWGYLKNKTGLPT
jgi:hypothetical protein